MISVQIGMNKRMREIMSGVDSVRLHSLVHREIVKTTLDVHGETRARAPVKTGRLRASVDWRVIDLFGEVSVNVDYAIYNEKNKPFLQPSLEKYERDFFDSVFNIVQYGRP